MMADCAFNNLTKIDEQKSTTGFLALFVGAVFFGKTKLQPTIALSSTEGEIRAGCTTAKCALYLRKVLADVGLQQDGPTPIYEDNQATIQFSNHNRPSGRTRHIAREGYATQEWVQDGQIIFLKIDTKVNPADAMTKLLYKILHQRHFYQIMGRYGSPHAQHLRWLDNPYENPPQSTNKKKASGKTSPSIVPSTTGSSPSPT